MKFAKPKTRGWKKGPPPSVGWWPASYFRAPDQIRWWDGRVWSRPARTDMTADVAAFIATMPAKYSFDVEWAERWWEA